MVEFSTLTGIPVHWGTWGRTGSRKLRPVFLAALELALEDLWKRWGRCPTDILSGGAYVPPPHPPRHSWGTAFDLSGFSFADESQHWELWREWRESPRKALAVEAVLRLHLSQVLGPWYNRSHRDHWHLDDKPVAGFQPDSPCDVRFLQACLCHIWRPANARELAIDGRYGGQTARAVGVACDEIGEPAVITDGGVWRTFLEATAAGGFGRVESG